MHARGAGVGGPGVHRAGGICSALLLISCASAPLPDAGSATLWGRVALEPHADLPPGATGVRYTAPALREARPVDYVRPGFAVVYAAGAPAPRRDARIELHDRGDEVELDPARVAVSSHGRLEIANLGSVPRAISVPVLGLVRRLEPGGVLRLAAPGPGPLDVFVAGTGARAVVFAAPGPFAVTSARGDWALVDLPPGPHRVHVWHPRFPPDQIQVRAPAGERTRVDLRLGVTASRGAQP